MIKYKGTIALVVPCWLPPRSQAKFRVLCNIQLPSNQRLSIPQIFGPEVGKEQDKEIDIAVCNITIQWEARESNTLSDR